jgi:hypothetical protein
VYTVDAQDRVVELDDAPPADPGAAMAVVFSDEMSVVLAYRLAEISSAWQGKYVREVSHDTPSERIAVVRFAGPLSHYLGPPNDEAFSGHPLYSRGLKPYSIAEIVHSSWVRNLARMNSAHPMHRPDSYNECRHFIFAFHDATFECIADAFAVELHIGSMRLIVAALVQELA